MSIVSNMLNDLQGFLPASSLAVVPGELTWRKKGTRCVLSEIRKEPLFLDGSSITHPRMDPVCSLRDPYVGTEHGSLVMAPNNGDPLGGNGGNKVDPSDWARQQDPVKVCWERSEPGSS